MKFLTYLTCHYFVICNKAVFVCCMQVKYLTLFIAYLAEQENKNSVVILLTNVELSLILGSKNDGQLGDDTDDC